MSDTVLIVLGVLELLGLIALFALIRRASKRRADGKERDPRWVRISTALFGLVVVVAFPVFMIFSIVNPSYRNVRRHQQLVQTGTPATATITQIKETGRMINRRPEVQVRLTVQPQGAPPFDSQSTWVFSINDAQTYRVGSR